MNKKLRYFSLLFLFFILFSSIAVAPSYALPETKAPGIYIAGNPNFYPFEYYNEKTKQFEGIIPAILNDISLKSGIPLIYITETTQSQAELAESGQATILSGYNFRGFNHLVNDAVSIFSYSQNDAPAKIGIAFTAKADREIVEKLKMEINSLATHEINNYLIQNNPHSTGKTSSDQLIFFLLISLLLCLVLFYGIRLRKLKQKILDNKLIDENTGIGNLTYFETKFVNAIPSFSNNNHYVAYIILDNNFLQHHYGKSVFSDVIEHAAHVLTVFAKENDSVARITESGFAAIFTAETTKEAEERVVKLLSLLNDLVLPGKTNEIPVFYSSFYNLQPGDNYSEVILFNLRRNCNNIVGSDRQYMLCNSLEMNSAIEEKKLAETYKRAMKNKEFKLYLQFSVDAKTKKISSAEALSRWEHPEKGLLYPGTYIDSLETVGLIQQFDYYMFDKVCQQLHKWQDTPLNDITISCNFTRITLSERNFLDTIKEITNKYVFDHKKLIIEITENAIEKDRKNAFENVFGCKNLGFTIALDDLGNGYTSLINLCDYPIDIVKIDRDIMLKTKDKSGRDLFDGLVFLMHSLNKKIVCEGVETEEQNDFVSASNCDHIQGWFYFKAMTVKECENAFREYKSTDKI